MAFVFVFVFVLFIIRIRFILQFGMVYEDDL